MRDCLPLSGLGLGVSHTEGYKALQLPSPLRPRNSLSRRETTTLRDRFGGTDSPYACYSLQRSYAFGSFSREVAILLSRAAW